MSFAFSKGIFKICVAQICQNIGWHAVQSTPMDILVDVLHRYLLEISKTVHRYSNQYGRTEPNLDDVALTFKDFGIILQELEEYVSNVEPVPFVRKLQAFPVAHPSHLQSPNPGNRELLHRPEHIPEHLPLMHPELEEEDGLLSPVFESGIKKNLMDTSGPGEGETPSPLNSPKHGSKRPNEWSNDIPAAKKPRHYSEEEGRPMREMTSVFMTPTGFISPVREGKAAEPSLPNTIDSPPSTPESSTPTPDTVTLKKEYKNKEAKKEKSSKSKKDKEISKKETKKGKSSKKENKENSAFSGEKSGTSVSSGKKEKDRDHVSSHKSSGKSDKISKSGESSRVKSKSEKGRSKEREEHRKSKEHSKFGKGKSKMKHSSSSFSKSMKSPKSSKSPQKSAKSPKKSSSKSPKSEKKIVVPLPPVIRKEEVTESNFMKLDVKEDRIQHDIRNMTANDDDDDYLSREESPEPRLVIDDSIETQNRQERESRLAVLDACITAVIQRGQEESELEAEKSHKSVDQTIDEVIRGPVVRRLEPKDIYDFTDSSELSSLSSLEGDDSFIETTPIKKEKSKTPDSERSFESPKKVVKVKKKRGRKPKNKSPGAFASAKNQKSPNVIVKREERSPSPIKLKDEIFSSDESISSRSQSPSHFFDLPQHSQKHLPRAPSLSELPSPSPFAPSTSFSSSPFAPIRPLSCHIQSNPHFPTPPLFVTSKTDQSSMFQGPLSPQPLNLAKSNPATTNSKDTKVSDPYNMSNVKSENVIDGRKMRSDTSADKQKAKNQQKDKKEKEKPGRKGKKRGRKEKPKEKEKIESAKEKTKEKPKPKTEKVVKEEKKVKMKPEKKKDKEREAADDSAVPKFTLNLKLSSGFVKSSSKRTQSPPPSPEEEELRSSPTREPTPSPPRVATPPAPRAASPPSSPVRPSTPPASAVLTESPQFALPVATVQPSPKTTHSRGRGRGRKPAAQVAVQPPARTVITETLGTIVDESGNKIWICPACTRPDDGSPMIGCDECDDWYHWVCVGIVVPPKEEESWYCIRCISKRQSVPVKRRRKKHKKDK